MKNLISKFKNKEFLDNFKENLSAILVPGSLYKEYKKYERDRKDLGKYISIGIYSAVELARLATYGKILLNLFKN